jgi:hypothetical protein
MFRHTSILSNQFRTCMRSCTVTTLVIRHSPCYPI